jgi:hypothetical protein
MTCAVSTHAGDDPFADEVISYVPGTNADAGYDDSSVAVGSPERFSCGTAVTIMSSAWLPEEIVSVGTGGSLVLRFDTPVVDDPRNPFGIDLMVFGNSFFSDFGSPPNINSLFNEGGVIEVSPDNVTWATIPGVEADGLFPTQGWLDTEAFDPEEGTVETDFTRPVDPSLTFADFEGLTYEEALALYRTSGGGAGVDIAGTGFPSISYVRITQPGKVSVEIDAMSDARPVDGDTNGDTIVDVVDLVNVIVSWGDASPTADVNGDGIVDVLDLVAVIVNWS